MSERIVFLDIDGPVIPFSMFLIDRYASINRVLAPIPVAVVKMICERSGAKVVFNTTHNINIQGVVNIDHAMVKAGFPAEYIHEDFKTKYPDLPRDTAVMEWMKRHPEVTDWVALDDTKFMRADNVIWVDPDAGLHLGHLNAVLDRWGCTQFFVL